MVFNIWMIYDALLPFYSCEMILQGEAEQTLENIRLYFAGDMLNASTMYVESGRVIFGNGDSRVYCVHGKNYFVVDSANVNAVFNTVICTMEKIQARLNKINMMIANNCLLSEVLSEFHDKLPCPMMVLDASQTALAISEKYGKGTIDESWDRMIETGSLGLEAISRYNSLYADSVHRKDFYRIPADPFPYPSYNRNIYINGEFMGFLSLILLHGDLSDAERGWYYTAWEEVCSWVRLHAENNSLLLSNAVFEELLTGNVQNMDYFLGSLSAFGWHKGCRKQLIVLECVSSHLNMNAHIAKLLNTRHRHLYAVEYQDKLVLLCNIDNCSFEKQLRDIRPVILNSGYRGGSSNSFEDLTELPHYYLQAVLPLGSGAVSVGDISPCEEYILPYMFQLLKRNARMSLSHPSLDLLQEYDRRHHSNYAEVLYCYLKNQCSQTDTARQLNMHRSTLLRKLNRIQQMTGLDLTDYRTRLHLLLSCELQSAGSE